MTSTLPEVELGNDEPLYNIGVVARMTGISMATLRAWERRYHFPSAKRTAGGHRLYSERDILRLRWVKERIDEGMQTSQSIIALRHQEQTGRLAPGHPIPPIEIAQSTGVSPTVEGVSLLKKYQQGLYEALIKRDLGRADELLGEAAVFATPEDLIINVFVPVLARLGEAWERGEVAVGIEHFATNYIRQRMLMWMLNAPPAIRMPPIVLACAPNEWHEGSLLIIGALLRRRRWPVAYLGQAMPLQDLATFIEGIHPSLLIVVAMTEETAMQLLEWPKWLPDVVQTGKPIVGYGGRVFVQQPMWRAKMPGVYLGDTFEDGLLTIERLLQTA